MRSLLVANRGEIATRIFQTCREMGIQSWALSAENDTASNHTLHADRVLSLGSGPLSSTFLNGQAIVQMAAQAGIEAIHPGYGFLSENAEFAEMVTHAGLLFIGPPAAAMRAMGLKREAKWAVSAAGVPVIPGYSGEDQDPATLRRAAGELGYPILIKASAGGGGKGMKIASCEGDFFECLESAQREAQAAFGDSTVILEKYIAHPRHIEIQVFGDQADRLVALGERECSIQRRHQKIIEEAPSPAVSASLRAAMAEAALAAARAVNYRSAGTVEFILDEQGQFYFLEMNTRLQVEHPVTEMVTGLDLVRLQIEVAEGAPLTLDEQVSPRGWAIEARLYAENPYQHFLPQMGRILRWQQPSGLGIRMDSGSGEGREVGMHFDPMLAKLIAYGPHREAARLRLQLALERTFIHGVNTNIGFLQQILSHPAFIAGDTTTSFIASHFPHPSPAQEYFPLAAALALAAAPEADNRPSDGHESSRQGPWQSLGPWRGSA
jgi:3-methylcrotonyl-CoA carboxylase alpha subunit